VTGKKGVVTPEASLTSRIQSGDRAAEEELIARFSRGVYLMTLVRVRDEGTAEDLAQETLVSVIQALREDKLRRADSLTAYVAGTARNLARTHLRNERRRARLTPSQPVVDQENPESVCQRSELLQLATRALARLSLDDKEILLLSLVEELSPTEIANHLSLRPEAVRQRKLRALRRVKRICEDLSRNEGRGHRQ